VTRVWLHTFGCKANQYDTELVRRSLVRAGASVVGDWAESDVAIVNSCAVTHVSEAKLRGLVRRIARANPSVRTVVMGCAAALDDGTIAALPNVVGVVEGADPATILQALDLSPSVAASALRSFDRGARAWLKIQDGCDEHCTFCVSRLARGESRSRPPQVIVDEALALSARHAEIVLTGVHVGAYGADRAGDVSLCSLVERLVLSVPHTRFRLTSVEATEIDEGLAEIMAAAPNRLAPHVHAPLQSGSDRVLRYMGRHWYSAATYRARIELLAERINPLGLGADVMVGFPMETDEDFAETRLLLEALPYTYIHVFPYSERPRTAAHRLGPPADPRLAASRSALLRSIVAAKAAGHRRRRAGTDADVVLLRRSEGRFEGLTEDYLTVSGSTDRRLPSRFHARLAVTDGGQLTAVATEIDE
jgi:threonylcarbamoyladenosine tRNA methylthiotransferase MtaB